MSRPVDVLCVMEEAELALQDFNCSATFDKVRKARAAVAELIEAGMAATEEKMHDGASSREACERLVAALTRVRGAA